MRGDKSPILLLDEDIGFTEHYWACDCIKDNIRASWFELWCEVCGLKREEGHDTSMVDVMVELVRDGRLQRDVKEFFKEENTKWK